VTSNIDLRPRTFVVVDLENACGRWGFLDQLSLAAQVRHFDWRLPRDAVGVVAGNRLLLRRTWPLLPSGWRLRVAATSPDAADLLLLDELAWLPSEVGHVVIVSGDGIFAEPTRWLTGRGLTVDIVCPEGSISRELARAATTVTLFPSSQRLNEKVPA
jgi:hypothetical protein